MILKFVMRDDNDTVVAGTPTVTEDGIPLTPTPTAFGWTVVASPGSLVTCTLAGARTLDVLMPSVDPTALPTAAQNADAVWDEAVADHVTSGTFGRFLQRVYRYFFNKTLHTNTSMVVYADDGTTSDAVMAVSGDTSSVTKGAAS